MKKIILTVFVVLAGLYGCATVPGESDLTAAVPEVPSAPDVSTDGPSSAPAAGEPAEAAGEPVYLSPDVLEFPCLAARGSSDFDLASIVNGSVTEVAEDELGYMRVAVEVSLSYYYEGTRTAVFEYVFGGMKSVSVGPGDQVSVSQHLGLASPDSYMTARCGSLDPYMVRMTASPPYKYKGLWYYSPDWAMAGRTAWLSFRPVPSFKYTMMDYYNRLIAGGEPAEGVTLRSLPSLDRIRAKVVLSGYPEPAERTEAVRLLEDEFFGGNRIYVFKTVFDDDRINGYAPVILWQHDFDKYLASEYEPGSELFIYGTICAIDHENREILIGVRDFSLQSDEEIVDGRISELGE